MEKRADDFLARRKHLAGLSDAELKARYEGLLDKLISPLIEEGERNTTPAIERSVLLRMGFSSIEAARLVEAAVANGLLGHGAGNIVYRYSKEKSMGIREAGLRLIEKPDEWQTAVKLFGQVV